MTFDKFKTIVRSEGGIWAGPYVHFTRTQSEFNAAYRPNYPEASPQDEDIHCVVLGGLWSNIKASDRT